MDPKVDPIAIVTGAAGGLGLATAIALAPRGLREGYQLALCDRAWPSLADAIGEIRSKVPDAITMARGVDVTRATEITRFLDDVMGVYGRVDVLVNNAGYAHLPSRIEDLSPEEYILSSQTNAYGPYVFMHYALPIMVRQYREYAERSVIVNVASKAARWPTPRMSAYSASKAALVALTQAVAKELQEAEVGVKVVSISPGGMNTPMRAKVAGEEDAARQQSPEVVADVIAQIVKHGAVDLGPLVKDRCFEFCPCNWCWCAEVEPETRNECRCEHCCKTGGTYEVPNGADVLVWKEKVTVYPMEDVR